MTFKAKRSFAIYVLFAVACAAIVLVAVGFWVCSSLSIAFDHLQRIQLAQAQEQSALSLQIRADVELQEFARFRVSYFYEPQLATFASEEFRHAEAAAVACCGHKGDRSFSNAQQIATTWTEQVAGRIFAHPQSASGPRSLLVATYDKVLIDQYSGELSKIDFFLNDEAQNATSDVRQAINRIVYIFAALVVVFVSAAVCCRTVAVSATRYAQRGQ